MPSGWLGELHPTRLDGAWGIAELDLATLFAGVPERYPGPPGPGIPDSIQATLFEPFVTTKPEGKGTGLGLSTVLMVVERHKGRIDFTTSPNGTTFRITLPAAH